MPTRKKYKSCKFDKKNRCQKKDSGGHIGIIKSLNKHYCAKAIDTSKNSELRFYKRNCSNHKTKKREICKFLPTYHGVCIDNNNKVIYIVLDDLTKGMKNPFGMDIKIGKLTASYTQLIGKNKKISPLKKMKFYTKKMRHILTSSITISNKYGFRGISLPGKKRGKLKFILRLQIGMLFPQKLFSIYFKDDKQKDSVRAIIKKLKKMNKFVQSDQFNEYSFVGSSILFIYDNTKKKRDNVQVAMIDFSRFRQSKRMTANEKKYREYFREGMQSLLDELLVFLKKDIKK